MNCKIGNSATTTDFIVVPLTVQTVLGLDSCCKLELVKIPTRDSKCEERSECEIKCSEAVIHHHNTSQTPVSPPQQNGVSESVPPLTSINSTKCVQSREVRGNLNKVLAEFQDVFSESTMGCLGTEPYKIKLKKNVVPVIKPVRKIAFARKKQVEEELERMKELGAIIPVEEPTEWVNSMVVTEKPETGKIRLCLDPTALNNYIMREHTSLPTEEEILSRLQKATIFTKLDAKDGYWQVKLDEESSYLTTFNTHVGRFRYLRLPFGLSSANEVFQKRMIQVFEGLPGIIVMFDDILVYGENQQEHDSRLEQALRRARQVGLKLNRRKCKFQLPQVKYIGHVINAKGISPDPQKVEDIKNMPRPTDKTGVQRILGTLNYLCKFIPNMSELTAPLRTLLVKGVEFVWTFEQEAAMKKIIDVLTTTPVLGFYDTNKEILLTADASQHGLGACIMQDGKPIAYASRALTATQKNYAQIEKELLSIVFGAERFYQYLYGKKVKVETDHKPLIPLFKKPIFESPARIQRLMLRLQRYDLDVEYKPGKFMHIPDTLSRAVSTASSEHCHDDLDYLEKEADLMVHAVIENLNCSSEMKDRICVNTESDVALLSVKSYIQNGWPLYIKDCIPCARPYWNHRASLAYVAGMILFGDRIVVPLTLRNEILNRIHAGHQGRERCKISARRVVYWPDMNAHIDNMVDRCEACLLTRSAPAREPLKPHAVPERAWQKIACDLYSYAGEKWQIITDYFSKWVEIRQMPTYSPCSKNVIEHLKSACSRFGICEEIFSDGDSLYNSREFKTFCKEYGISHTFSSSRYPQSNGMIEASVKHIKHLIRRCRHSKGDLYLALLDYRNTPLTTKLGSPAQLLMGRNLRTTVPCIDKFVNTPVDNENRKLILEKQAKGEMYYNRATGNERNVFKAGETIKYRETMSSRIWQPGQILRATNPDHRSYELVNKRGHVIRRNNRMLLPDRTGSRFQTDVNDMPPLDSDPVHVPVPRTVQQPRTPPVFNPDPAPGVTHPQPPAQTLTRQSARLANKARQNYREPVRAFNFN